MKFRLDPGNDQAVPREHVKLAQRRLRALIAEAIASQDGRILSLGELATAVEAELVVHGFDARVAPPEEPVVQPLPLANGNGRPPITSAPSDRTSLRSS